jgi:cbb3-type cytochrome oxidase subunit 1
MHIGKDEVTTSWHAMEDEVAVSCSCTWCIVGYTCGIVVSCNLTFPAS